MVNPPELAHIFENITVWGEKDFARTLFQSDAKLKDFKLVKVSKVSRVWKENNVWVVDALIEYEFGGAKKRNVTFQVNSEGKIVGFNLYESVKG
jgi:hypothetical protein